MVEKGKKPDQIAIIKGKFKAINTNTYGLFILFINKGMKIMENLSVVCSHFSSLYEHDPKLSWDKFEEEIFALKWKGEVSGNISHDVQQYITSNINSDTTFEMLEAIEQKKISKIENTLIQLLEKALIDHNILMELDIEDVTQDGIRKAKDERARREKEQKEEKAREELKKEEPVRFSIEAGSVLLKVDLVLGPVSGIPIYELKAGDKIMVRIAGRTEKEKYFIDLLNANADGNILPIPASVKEVQVNNIGEYEILTEIGPGIYGRSTESERVKLKKYDETQDLRKLEQQKAAMQPQAAEQLQTAGTSDEKAEAYKTPQRSNFIWLLGGATILLAIIVLLLLVMKII